jgi:hypothetical protein
MKKRIFLLTILAALIFHFSQNAFAQSETLSSSPDLLHTIEQKYDWNVDGDYTDENLMTILEAGALIESYVTDLTGSQDQAWIKTYLGNAEFHINGALTNSAREHKIKGFVFPNTDIYLPAKFTARVVIHELGHVLDNNQGETISSVWFGGGPADQMIKDCGGHPEEIPFPHFKDRLDYRAQYSGPEAWPEYTLGARNPTDDFADTFLVAVTGEAFASNIQDFVPQRLAWMDAYISNLK